MRLVRRFARRHLKGSLFHGDALEFLETQPPESAQLVFLDPPFNLGKTYGLRPSAADSMEGPKYEAWMRCILVESVRVLSEGGALYLYHLPSWAMRFGAFLDSSLDFRHWIAVSMKNGFKRGLRLYPAHYALLFLTKGNPSAFEVPIIEPLRCSKCKRYAKDYGGYSHIIEKRGGVNLSDVWEDLSPVRHRSKKNRTANELPSQLFRRVLSISGQAGGTLLDPFAGGGSSLVAAAEAGMSFKGCDIVYSNCLRAEKRLSTSTLNGGS